MLRWLLVTDYDSEDFNWADIDKKELIHYTVDSKVDPGDKIMVYLSGQLDSIPHIFEVKEAIHLEKENIKFSFIKK